MVTCLVNLIGLGFTQETHPCVSRQRSHRGLTVKGRFTLNAHDTALYTEVLDFERGGGKLAPVFMFLCFLIADALRAAASHLICQPSPVMDYMP